MNTDRTLRKILTSSIDSSLSTCLHCVVIIRKSNNVSFPIDVSASRIAAGLKSVFRMSGS